MEIVEKWGCMFCSLRCPLLNAMSSTMLPPAYYAFVESERMFAVLGRFVNKFRN